MLPYTATPEGLDQPRSYYDRDWVYVLYMPSARILAQTAQGEASREGSSYMQSATKRHAKLTFSVVAFGNGVAWFSPSKVIGCMVVMSLGQNHIMTNPLIPPPLIWRD